MSHFQFKRKFSSHRNTRNYWKHCTTCSQAKVKEKDLVHRVLTIPVAYLKNISTSNEKKVGKIFLKWGQLLPAVNTNALINYFLMRCVTKTLHQSSAAQFFSQSVLRQAIQPTACPPLVRTNRNIVSLLRCDFKAPLRPLPLLIRTSPDTGPGLLCWPNQSATHFGIPVIVLSHLWV